MTIRDTINMGKQEESWGPPPSYEAQADPPPYHNWQDAVPDTSVFPPPPVAGFYASGTGNASSDDAERAHDFCNNTPLWLPVQPSAAVYNTVAQHDLRPVRQHEFLGELHPAGLGRWQARTVDGAPDALLTSHLPLYFAAADSPAQRSKQKTIYFEVRVGGLRAGPGGSGASGFSIGFVAQPYPSWRSPGWERGSLGVFSDDGCRFVNDSWGGREFASAFNVGETVGLGMSFSVPENASESKSTVEVFFTRNGARAGGWDLHEEMDADSGGIEGLEGDYDLYAAIGVFGGVDFECCFDPAGWLYNPLL